MKGIKFKLSNLNHDVFVSKKLEMLTVPIRLHSQLLNTAQTLLIKPTAQEFMQLITLTQGGQFHISTIQLISIVEQLSSHFQRVVLCLFNVNAISDCVSEGFSEGTPETGSDQTVIYKKRNIGLCLPLKVCSSVYDG